MEWGVGSAGKGWEGCRDRPCSVERGRGMVVMAKRFWGEGGAI